MKFYSLYEYINGIWKLISRIAFSNILDAMYHFEPALIAADHAGQRFKVRAVSESELKRIVAA